MKEWLYFDYDDFACKCCGENQMDPGVIDMLDKARAKADIPFVVTSGYRCEKHNEAEGSTSDVHPKGLAADIRAHNSINRMKVVEALIHVGFKRIGIHKRFIHGDLDDSRVDCMWVYS